MYGRNCTENPLDVRNNVSDTLKYSFKLIQFQPLLHYYTEVHSQGAACHGQGKFPITQANSIRGWKLEWSANARRYEKNSIKTK